ncbi:MAG: TetR/AcrR family transcriptional regulator [Acidimicrobiales bacterium]|nr:TetR/AcrR family transcriptional regulator [Acidimicrobiales bacterium]
MIPVTARPTPAPEPLAGPALEARILRAARDCVADRGLRATTIEDVAAAAGCGRASIYRIVPGGRRGLLRAVVAEEVATLFDELGVRIDAAADLAGAVVDAVNGAAVHLADHAALQRLLADEPGVIMPFISFDGAAPLLASVSAWGGGHFRRFLPADEAEAVAEWAARLVLSHLQEPHDLLVLTDPVRVRHLVETYLLPGVRVGVPA